MSARNITGLNRPAGVAAMNTVFQFFAHHCTAVWTLLRGAPVVNCAAELAALESDLLGDLSELAKPSV